MYYRLATRFHSAQTPSFYAVMRKQQRSSDDAAKLAHEETAVLPARTSSKALRDDARMLTRSQLDMAIRAVQYLERYFELARSIGDRQLIDKARTYLGIARGNSVLPAFMNVVTNDLDALLRWKNRRTPFTESVR